MSLFNAAVKLDIRSVPPGMEPALAASKVAAAILAMPGAGQIWVDWCDGSTAGSDLVRVSQADDRFTLDGAACRRIAALVEAELRRALFPALAPVRR